MNAVPLSAQDLAAVVADGLAQLGRGVAIPAGYGYNVDWESYSQAAFAGTKPARAISAFIRALSGDPHGEREIEIRVFLDEPRALLFTGPRIVGARVAFPLTPATAVKSTDYFALLDELKTRVSEATRKGVSP